MKNHALDQPSQSYVRHTDAIMSTSSEDDDTGSFDAACLYDDLTLLEACQEGDIESVQNILEDTPTDEEINESDRTGKTALSHACVLGLTPVVELLSETPGVDPNIGDKDGTTPLIFAAQAGYREIVKFLLNDFRKIHVDQRNKLGFTALMKAAIQGRTSCAKLLLYAGANPKLRDHGRKLCAEEWARFTGRQECADEIAKFINTKRFLSNSRNKKVHERSNSEPDLTNTCTADKEYMGRQRKKSKSLRKKLKKMIHGHSAHSNSPTMHFTENTKNENPFAIIARCVSTPILPGVVTHSGSPPVLKRPVSAENIPRVEITSPSDRK
ncbi:ankyrin repeat domain-containing protein 33B-like [Ylistrum balloti]|uniref:ankyrin repeat domain-containing protein 33B-like n=1 Tax=Ylistrum balloti TaxID=509963 RepID=UPI002905C90B|nr:ankyrin repeat domain-containing protein 33B-like [Ylistrum balloti]